jgi:hypothetical protein
MPNLVQIDCDLKHPIHTRGTTVPQRLYLSTVQSCPLSGQNRWTWCKYFAGVLLTILVSVQSCPCMSNIIIIDDLECLPELYIEYFYGHLRRAVHGEDVCQHYLD